ncbi:MAG TPA: hypothetical protein VG755_04780 [Nannocystaceae bacterium]|nr:hypothetical protein [Nannocystaceae bacterium]
MSATELVAQHLGGAPRPVGDRRRQLVVRGVTVATVGPDPAAITPMCAVSARDLPVVDILAALAAQDPTGVLVIEAGDEAFAFEVIRGRLAGARGTGPLDRVESFVAEVHRKQPERFSPRNDSGADTPAWMQVARTFVEERVLDQLQLCLAPGARMTLVRGDVEWIGTRLPEGVGPTLAHVLLEHARRSDETPRILATLGSMQRVAIPMIEPGTQPHRPAQLKGPSEGWDFFDDPDPAALAEWDDARRIWQLCDGESTMGEIIDNAMIGHFRASLALHTLVVGKHIVLVDGERAAAAAAESGPRAAVIPMRPSTFETQKTTEMPRLGNASPALRVAEQPAAPEPEAIEVDPETSGTSYSMVIKRVKPRRRQAPPPLPSSQPPRPPKMYFDRAPDTEIVEVVQAQIAEASAAAMRQELVDASAASTRRDVIPVEVAAELPTRRDVLPVELVEEDPAAQSIAAARSVAAAAAIDKVLPSPKLMMAVLGATGVVALVAAAAALL